MFVECLTKFPQGEVQQLYESLGLGKIFYSSVLCVTFSIARLADFFSTVFFVKYRVLRRCVVGGILVCGGGSVSGVWDGISGNNFREGGGGDRIVPCVFRYDDGVPVWGDGGNMG